MTTKTINLMVIENTLDVVDMFKGYTHLKVETVFGNLWFFKDRLQLEDAVKIEDGKTYKLDGIVQIQNMGFGKSAPTIYGQLF